MHKAALIFITSMILSPAMAAAPDDHASHGVAAKPATTAAATGVMTSGEVRRIDKAAKKLTLKHEAIKNLDMPAMTMVFQVSNAGMLDKLKVGEKVKFHAESPGGTLTVTHIEASK